MKHKVLMNLLKFSFVNQKSAGMTGDFLKIKEEEKHKSHPQTTIRLG